MAVTNYAGNSVSILMGVGNGSFLAPVNYAASNPVRITAGDFNSDGNVDLAIANSGTNKASILMGSPTGTFAPSVHYSVGNAPSGITSADLNNDGKLDLVLSHFTSTFISVLLNTGTGTFNAAVNYSTGFYNGSTVICRDYDGDTKIDILSGSTGKIHFFKGSGTGTFSPVVNTIPQSQPYSIVSKDFNGDGILDLVTGEGGSNIETYTISPTAVITAVGNYSTSTGDYSDIATDDFNNDGKFDLAVSSYGTNELIIFLNGLPNLLVTATASNICNGNSTTLTGSGANTYSWSTGASTNSIIVTPTTTTIYTLTGTGQNSCSNTITKTITVNTPTLTVNSGSICSGSSFTINSTGASTYTYSGGSAIVSPTSNAIYTVTGTSAAGCTNTAVSNVAVTNTVSPSILLSTPNTTICSTSAAFNSTITNGGTSPLYQWKKNGVNVGSGLTSYSPTSLVNGDVVSCILTSNATCATPTSVVSNSITMTVGATPTITVNSGSICSGSSFTFNPTGASTYAYNGGNAIVNPANNTSYTVTGTSVAGCTNNAVSTITVNALPILTATTNNTLICTGSTATLSVMGAMSYTWNTGSNLASYPVTPTTTASYTVIGTDVNGCTNNAVITQSVSLCTGVDEIVNENLLSIYPNPNNGVFTISTQKDAQLIIVNQLGEIVLEQLITSGENKLDVQNQATGLYFVKISAQGSVTTFKVIKN